MGIFDSITKATAGSAIGIAASMFGGGKKGKIKKRVGKLENQVKSMLSKQNQGPVANPMDGTNVLTPPQPEAGLIGQENEDIPELAQPSVSTIGSPFGPGAAAAGNNMFGAQVPGSFDRDMGEEEEIY